MPQPLFSTHTTQVATPALLSPATLALALSAAFCAGPGMANPTGGQVIAGQASFSAQGNNLVVTTQNAPGTQSSAINWQSFSIPAGSSTRFVQPNANSTSINRVVSNNPSAIYGTLSSNGHVVLVNPSGITVGAGAVVDTAGFTASSLQMSTADAQAGRLRFSADGSAPNGAVTVQGTVIARNGDVVLIAPSVEVAQTGIVQSPNGSVILAAGQSVEVTGRGLEGIRLTVQAPTDQAVNLGTLSGDAVGIFATNLRHSGSIDAKAVTAEGGRIILRAQDTAIVEGSARAERLNRLGGLFQATANKVGLSGTAVVDASGASGGGEILIGGDYQGKNPNVQNAQMTFVGEGAQLRANATEQGNGGKVIVWSDRSTRIFGSIEAKGGTQGGNGGLVETSGKQGLETRAKVDVSAPLGKGGTLLLDPASITIIGGERPSTVTLVAPPSTCTNAPAFCPPAPAPVAVSTPGVAPNQTISFVEAGPTEIFQSDLQGYAPGTNVVLEATDWIGVAGRFTGQSVTMSNNTNLTMRTRNAPTDGNKVFTGIKLNDGPDGANLEFRTQGTGSITLETGTAGSGAQNANISVGRLTTGGGNITLNAQGSGSDVILLGNINAGGGSNNLRASGQVRFDGAGPLVITGSAISTNAGNGTLINTEVTNNSGAWVNASGQTLLVNGLLHAGTANGNFSNQGRIDLVSENSVIDTGNQNLTNAAGASLVGNGIVNVGTGTLVNEGTVAPGHSPGTLTVNGNYRQTSSGSLVMEVASNTTFDRLRVTGTATLGGALVMQGLGYTPTAGETYPLVQAGSVNGTFAQTTSTALATGAPYYQTSEAGFTVGASTAPTTPTTPTTPATPTAPTPGTTTGTGTGATTGGTTGATGTTTGSGTTPTLTPPVDNLLPLLVASVQEFGQLVERFNIHTGNTREEVVVTEQLCK